MSFIRIAGEPPETIYHTRLIGGIRLISTLVCALISLTLSPAWSQAASQERPLPVDSPKPPDKDRPRLPAEEPKQSSPFENVPELSPAPPAPQPKATGTPQLEGLKPATPRGAPSGDVIASIEFRGARRVPQDTLRALISTKKGDIFNRDALHRDFMALWNTGRFDDVRLEAETSKSGLIVRFVVAERPIVRTIRYENLKSVTQSEVLDRFKERKVGLSVESQYDPNKVRRAAVVLKEFLAERGRQFATVDTDLRQIPPSSLELTFNVNEGPKVKVGTIDIQGNHVFSSRTVIHAMKNLRPIGIPHSIFLEDLRPRPRVITLLSIDE